MSYAEVDQSGKIEQLNLDTVVALSNDRQFSVMIPKKVKKDLFVKYKGRLPGLKYKLFSIALFECLKDLINLESKIVICKEYTGHELLLKAQIAQLLDAAGLIVGKKAIRFSEIGKRSPAHTLALSVLRKDQKADRILDISSIEEKLKV